MPFAGRVIHYFIISAAKLQNIIETTKLFRNFFTRKAKKTAFFLVFRVILLSLQPN